MSRVFSVVFGFVVIAHAVSHVEATRSDEKGTKSAAQLPMSVDLRPRMTSWGLGPRSQGPRGTCSVFATAAALEFAVSKHFGQGTLLSVEYLNWAANEVTGDPTDGGFFHDLLKGFDRLGICPEADMPYQKRFNPQLRPSDQAIQRGKDILDLGLRVHWINPLRRRPGLTDDLLREIQAVLARGYPVAAGSSHSRLIVGYVVDAAQPGGGYFLIKDSGAAAYNTITFKFAADHVGDVFWVEAPARPRGSKPGQ